MKGPFTSFQRRERPFHVVAHGGRCQQHIRPGGRAARRLTRVAQTVRDRFRKAGLRVAARPVTSAVLCQDPGSRPPAGTSCPTGTGSTAGSPRAASARSGARSTPCWTGPSRSSCSARSTSWTPRPGPGSGPRPGTPARCRIRASRRSTTTSRPIPTIRRSWSWNWWRARRWPRCWRTVRSIRAGPWTWSPRPPLACRPPTGPASSTATSSPPTCCSPRPARSRSPTSGSPMPPGPRR